MLELDKKKSRQLPRIKQVSGSINKIAREENFYADFEEFK